MPRGSKPGERRGGRQKGTPNKVTSSIRPAAVEHGLRMIEQLVELAKTSDSDSVRVAAAIAVLDRAIGRPRQAVELEGTLDTVTRIERVIVDPRQTGSLN